MIRWNTKRIGWPMPSSRDLSIGTIADAAQNVVNRKCADCEADEDRHIHRKTEGQTPPVPGPARAAAAAQVLSHGGSPLSARERAYFEPRFGRDLSQVRVHTHGGAAAAAAQIQARAYTLAKRHRLRGRRILAGDAGGPPADCP